MSINNGTLERAAPSAERREYNIDTVSDTAERAYTIALFVYGGVGNLGNDASLKAMVATLRKLRPDARIVCICGDPDVVSRIFEIPSVPIIWPSPEGLAYTIANRLSFKQLGHLRAWYRTLKFVGGVDAIIMPGTGILDDFGLSSPFGFPYRLFMWSVSARLRGIPVAFVSTGAGPITHWASRFLMLTAARLACYRTYRDKVSNLFVHRHGIDDGADTIYPDLVLGLPLEDIDVSGPPSSHTGSELPKVIGIGVLDYYGWSCGRVSGIGIHRRYVSSIVQLIAKLGRNGHRVRILVGVEDKALIDELDEALRLANIDLNEPWIDIRTAKTLSQHASDISETDIVVGTRYHTVIASLMLRRPAIALSYANKFDAVMEDFGQEDYCEHAETFDVDRVIGLIQDLSVTYDEVRARLTNRLASSRARLAEQESHLTNRILSKF